MQKKKAAKKHDPILHNREKNPSGSPKASWYSLDQHCTVLFLININSHLYFVHLETHPALLFFKKSNLLSGLELAATTIAAQRGLYRKGGILVNLEQPLRSEHGSWSTLTLFSHTININVFYLSVNLNKPACYVPIEWYTYITHTALLACIWDWKVKAACMEVFADWEMKCIGLPI